METNRTEQLRSIKTEVFELRDSPLYEYRTQNGFYPVIGQGDHFAKIVIIGEAPGLDEARGGRPFVGKSGKVLDRLLSSINLSRDDIYITNVVKDRPPNNRNPLPQEIEAYSPFLLRQLQIIQPQAVVTLGKFAMEYVAELASVENKVNKISQCHGQSYPINLGYGKMSFIPMFHPAVALYSPEKFTVLKQDFAQLKSHN